MNKVKIIGIILIVVLVTIVTVLLGANNLVLHKPVVFGEAGYVIVDKKTPVKDVNATEVGIKSQNQTIKTTTQSNSVKQAPDITSQNVVKQQSVKVSNTSAKKSQTIKTTPVTAKTSQQKVQVANKTTSNVVSKTPTQVKTQVQEPVVKKQASVVPQKVEQPPVQSPKIEQQTPQKKVLTESEETIVWNKWRSDLQNQIMRDTKIGAPQGTVFRFSFTVDKFGNMSNIKVWSDNPVYTDLAVRVIKPIISGYQKKAILNFPEGTKRTIVNANGGFAISNRTEYSTPENYNDVEKVKTTQYK